MSNILQEYLVKLGFSTDDPAYRHLDSVMADAERTVTAHTGGILKRVLEMQAGVAGAFTSLSLAIVGMVDKVAMADQGYRLMGLRMLMTGESARKLDLITKGLGASLEEIIWDPELHRRAVMMSEDIDRWSRALGPDFEARMLRIRDFRMEFSRLEVAAKFLGMQFVGSLFEKLVPGKDAAEKLKNVHDWVTRLGDRIPAIADKLSTYAIPILKKTWEMFQEIGAVAKAAGLAFTNFIGLLSGDSSIKGATFSFEKMAAAIGHVGDWMARFFGWIAHAEELLAHFTSAVALALGGKFAEAAEEFKAGLKDLTGGSGLLLGAGAGGLAGSLYGAIQGGVAGAEIGAVGGPVSALIGGAIGAGGGATVAGTAGTAAGAGIGALFGKLREWISPEIGAQQKSAAVGAATSTQPQPMRAGSPPSLSLLQATGTRADIVAAIESTADRYGVPRSLMLAIAQHESGMRETDAQGRTLTSRGVAGESTGGALGIMQLMPGTAKEMGVDPNTALGNIEGGTRLMAKLLADFGGDTAKALAAYSAGEGAVKKYGGIPPFAETQRSVPEVLALQQKFENEMRRTSPAAAAAISQPTSAPVSASPSESLPQFILNQPAAAENTLSPAGQAAVGNPPQTHQVNPAVEAPSSSSFDSSKPIARIVPDWSHYPAISDSPASPVPDMNWAPVLSAIQTPAAVIPNVSTTSQTFSVDLGGIYITQPGADAHEIQRAVSAGVREGLHSQTQFDLAQLSPAW
jgi:hypothetical protein